VVASRKPSKKKKTKKVSQRAAKTVASKKRAKKTKVAVKKTKKIARKAKKTKKTAKKPAAKKTAKKTVRKSAKKATTPVSAPKQDIAVKKAGTKPKTRITKKEAVAATRAAAASSRGSIYYITTAIAYPNGLPHIGHAYEAIATDALARFQRLDGKDVFFLTGTDEHGLKMMQTAELEKLPTMEVATRNALRFKEMDERLNVSFDRFIRTTEERHHHSSQEIWRRMADNGDIYLDSYAGW
jgi:methionyl-tRNA synthetase